jgi:transposase-like protein
MKGRSSMSNRKYFSPEQKVAIIRRHLVEGVAVSELCEELGIHTTQYYNWQKQFFENGAVAFERRRNKANQRRQENAREKKIAQLEEKLQRKNEVVAELLEEHIQLKKAIGEP